MRRSVIPSSGQAAGSSCSGIEQIADAQRAASDHAACFVLLVTVDGQAERAIVRSLKQRRITAERARTVVELKTRLARADLAIPDVVFLDLELPGATGEEWVCTVRRSYLRAAVVAFGENLKSARAARLLGFGVPSLHKPVAPLAFAHVALQLCAAQARQARDGFVASPEANGTSRAGVLELALESYACVRALSKQQRLILQFYLSGENDKQIARTLLCSEATVYEHWRRMGKKAGGAAKSTVISDFHRFLVRN